MADNEQTSTLSPMFVNAKLVEEAFDCLARGTVKRATPHGELIWQKAMDLRSDILAHEPVTIEDSLILLQLGRDSTLAIENLARAASDEDEEVVLARIANFAVEASTAFAKLRSQIENQTGLSLHALGLDLVGITRQ